MQIYLKIYLVIHIICKQKHLLIHPSTLSSLHFGIYLYLHGHGLEDFVQIIPTSNFFRYAPSRVVSPGSNIYRTTSPFVLASFNNRNFSAFSQTTNNGDGYTINLIYFREVLKFYIGTYKYRGFPDNEV